MTPYVGFLRSVLSEVLAAEVLAVTPLIRRDVLVLLRDLMGAGDCVARLDAELR